MEEERDYSLLVEDAKKIAFLSLRNFFKNIGLDDSLFDHLFKTDVQIDYTEDITNGECATYDPNLGKNKDVVYLGVDYLDDMYNAIEDGNNRNVVILDIANSIVHELIHKARLVTLKEEVSLLNVSNEIFKNAEIYHKITKETKDYDDLLALSLLKEKSKSKYIPIKVKYYKNHYYTFVGYNKKSKSFDIFEKQLFDTEYKGNLDEFMLFLAKEASYLRRHIPSYSYRSFLVNNNHKTIFNSMDLYTDIINDHQDPIDSKQKVINKLSQIKYTLHYQEILEESVTEVLSNMIIMSRNKDRLDVYTLSNRLCNSDISNILKSAALLLNKGGINFIKGFILAPYDEEFRNVFKEYYQEDYDKVLSLYGKINKEDNEELSQELDDITSKKLTK